jgi:Rho-binding antiterminator
MPKYIPIDCKYYDFLELTASRKTVCTIVYNETENSVRTVESTIEDIFTKDKEEFIKLNDGTEIRLDKILSVNDTQF